MTLRIRGARGRVVEFGGGANMLWIDAGNSSSDQNLSSIEKRDNITRVGARRGAVPLGARKTAVRATISTWPFRSSVAIWVARAALMLLVFVQVPEEGLYSSALEKMTKELLTSSSPPATGNPPFGSSVAVPPSRAVFMLPVIAELPGLSPRAGTAVLVSSPMGKNPTNTSVRMAPNLCAFARIFATSSTSVRMTSARLTI
jgi:hypothetical protein